MHDPDLTDETLQGEIELVGDLVVAASGSKGPMSEEDIDRVLGISPASSHPAEGTDTPERHLVLADADDDAAGPRAAGQDRGPGG